MTTPWSARHRGVQVGMLPVVPAQTPSEAQRDQPSKATWATLVLVTGAVALRLACIAIIRPFAEDGLITLRYARNLADGSGWVFNRGDRVLGSTSVLWTVAQVPVVKTLNTDAVLVAVSLASVACFAAACWATIVLTRRWGLAPVTVFGLVAIIAVQEVLVEHAVDGMEMPLFTAVLLVVALLREGDRPPGWAFAAAGLAVLVRPEGVVLVLALALSWVPHWRTAITGMVTAALVVLPWATFATWYFGSPVPQSIVAKSGVLDSAQSGVDPWVALETFTGPHLYPGAFGAVGTLLVGVLVVLAVTDRRSKQPGRTVLWWYLVGTLAAWTLARGEIFEWYPYPTTWAALVLAAAGADRLFSVSHPFRRSTTSRVGTAIVMVVIAGVVLSSALRLAAEMSEERETQAYNEDVFRSTGEWLNRCTPNDTAVMLEPIGYVGYYSGRTVVDLAGLVSPEMAELRDRGGSWATEAIELADPGVVVLRQYEVPDNRFFAGGNQPMFATSEQRDAFLRSYRRVRRFGSGPKALDVFARDGLALACR